MYNRCIKGWLVKDNISVIATLKFTYRFIKDNFY